MAPKTSIPILDDGRFHRKVSEFRDRVEEHEDARFRAESGRYHLYTAWACPWAHRTLISRHLLGLEDAIGVSVVHWLMDDQGAWSFVPGEGYVDHVNGAADLQEVYHHAAPRFDGIGTVPVLWDKQEDTIVNNESRDIVRMFSTAFKGLHRTEHDLLPRGREAGVDAMIDANYETVNNGVYKAGFARNQEAYDEAIAVMFDRLEELEDLLSGQRFLLGDTLTEADVCLFPTLLRFDLVYVGHFKCNLRRIVDMPNLWGYTRDIYQHGGIRDTFDVQDTKRHYYGSHTSINRFRIVPAGPELDLDASHDRAERFS